MAFDDVRLRLTDDCWLLLSVEMKLLARQVSFGPWLVWVLQSLEDALDELVLDVELLADEVLELLDDDVVTVVEDDEEPDDDDEPPPPQAASRAQMATPPMANSFGVSRIVVSRLSMRKRSGLNRAIF